MAPIFTGSKFGFGGATLSYPPVLKEYVYVGAQQTTLFVDYGTTNITFAGIAMGSPGGGGGGQSGGAGGGGGAANLEGYTINPAEVYAGTTLYIGVGGPSSLLNTYVRTGSHSGPIIFELNRGVGGTGGAANPTYGSVAGGNGGAPGPRFNPGGTGTSSSNSGAGGGGGGGWGDNSPPVPGAPGGPGGSVTMSASFIVPNGGGPASPWTWGPSTSGGSGGGAPNGGSPAPNSGASGGGPGGPFGGGGGGGAAGVIFNSLSYGGGGGGGGGAFPGGSTGGNASPGFLIVQLSSQ